MESTVVCSYCVDDTSCKFICKVNAMYVLQLFAKKK